MLTIKIRSNCFIWHIWEQHSMLTQLDVDNFIAAEKSAIDEMHLMYIQNSADLYFVL